MRRATALLTASGLVLSSCSNDPEDVVLTSEKTLVARYSSLREGTFRVHQPSLRLNIEGDVFYLSEISHTLYMEVRGLPIEVGLGSRAVTTIGQVGAVPWGGAYRSPDGPHSCDGTLYVLVSTPRLLRGVFAASCGEVNALRGPHNFRLVEGGFAYVR